MKTISAACAILILTSAQSFAKSTQCEGSLLATFSNAESKGVVASLRIEANENSESRTLTLETTTGSNESTSSLTFKGESEQPGLLSGTHAERARLMTWTLRSSKNELILRNGSRARVASFDAKVLGNGFSSALRGTFLCKSDGE